MRYNISTTSTPEDRASFQKSIEAVSELRAEIEKQKQALQNKFKAEFDGIVSKFFVAVPSVKSVSWTQYTPYFNDGDECVFSIHTIEFASDLNEDKESYRSFSDETGFSEETYSLKKILDPVEFSLCEELESLIQDNEDIMQEIFGDHAFIILTADGSEVSEYSHD